MRSPSYTGQFKKDVKRAKKRGKNMGKLRNVIALLLANDPLPPEFGSHPLKGEWKPSHDLHIEPDWLLIYSTDAKTVLFERTGTHADLFRK
ncbi:MAG: type II toxin-antitoxin system YafQ family toxin [Burkholderiaceae bacterium]